MENSTQNANSERNNVELGNFDSNSNTRRGSPSRRGNNTSQRGTSQRFSQGNNNSQRGNNNSQRGNNNSQRRNNNSPGFSQRNNNSSNVILTLDGLFPINNKPAPPLNEITPNDIISNPNKKINLVNNSNRKLIYESRFKKFLSRTIYDFNQKHLNTWSNILQNYPEITPGLKTFYQNYVNTVSQNQANTNSSSLLTTLSKFNKLLNNPNILKPSSISDNNGTLLYINEFFIKFECYDKFHNDLDVIESSIIRIYVQLSDGFEVNISINYINYDDERYYNAITVAQPTNYLGNINLNGMKVKGRLNFEIRKQSVGNNKWKSLVPSTAIYLHKHLNNEFIKCLEYDDEPYYPYTIGSFYGYELEISSEPDHPIVNINMIVNNSKQNMWQKMNYFKLNVNRYYGGYTQSYRYIIDNINNNKLSISHCIFSSFENGTSKIFDKTRITNPDDNKKNHTNDFDIQYNPNNHTTYDIKNQTPEEMNQLFNMDNKIIWEGERGTGFYTCTYNLSDYKGLLTPNFMDRDTQKIIKTTSDDPDYQKNIEDHEYRCLDYTKHYHSFKMRLFINYSQPTWLLG